MQQEELITAFSEIFKAIGNSPTAGRISGLFYLSDQKFLTFEDIMEQLSISKSATSKALKILVERGQVAFITKEDSRKRYYYLSINGAIKSLYDWMEALGVTDETPDLKKGLSFFVKDENERNTGWVK